MVRGTREHSKAKQANMDLRASKSDYQWENETEQTDTY